jgi:hypothetical protein
MLFNGHLPSADAGDDAGYYERKRRELALIESSCSLEAPQGPTDLGGLLKRKFQSAALCRAETAAAQWSHTETRWGRGYCGSGAFEFDYEYQRADLTVEGPPPYPMQGLKTLRPVLYTASGMGALSAALLAMRHLWPGCRFDGPAGGYPETHEMIALLGGSDDPGAHRVAILDSTIDTPSTAALRLNGARAALFDTSCFPASSSRIALIVAAARAQSVPVMLVRSHTKLDCFGLEYGRLGSVVAPVGANCSAFEKSLQRSAADFIRLTGATALPMHFPPFASGKEYHALLRARSAWTIYCCRFLERQLKKRAEVLSFAHGLYFVLFPRSLANKDLAAAAAASLIRSLSDAGIPARHAGSFGFDFFASDWFEDPASHRVGIRLSVGDLPFTLIRRAAVVLSGWLADCAGAKVTISRKD